MGKPNQSNFRNDFDREIRLYSAVAANVTTGSMVEALNIHDMFFYGNAPWIFHFFLPFNYHLSQCHFSAGFFFHLLFNSNFCCLFHFGCVN